MRTFVLLLFLGTSRQDATRYHFLSPSLPQHIITIMCVHKHIQMVWPVLKPLVLLHLSLPTWHLTATAISGHQLFLLVRQLHDICVPSQKPFCVVNIVLKVGILFTRHINALSRFLEERLAFGA